jgi:hypothetical protein
MIRIRAGFKIRFRAKVSRARLLLGLGLGSLLGLGLGLWLGLGLGLVSGLLLRLGVGLRRVLLYG